ncbi:MAG: extracellular solute-binding protein [Oscillospiraceae bacterium]|jgi:multiple sugar transport system substrate-binding protein|nr:extracellular solute-binding protein [Oscillospiraceae bacterium]
MRKYITPFLIAAFMLNLTACSGGGGEIEEVTTNAAHEGVNDAVSKLLGSEALPDVEVTRKIKLLGWENVEKWIDETAPAGALFSQKYGVPEPERGNNIIEYSNCGIYAARYEELSKRITSGDSPDIFPFEARYYPYGVYVNLFQSIDGVIDLSAPEWEDSLEAISRFEWGGKNYCAVTELLPSYFLWYRKTILEEAGLDDPYALYKAGKWDWDVFLEMCVSFSDPVNGKYSLSGWDPDESLICTTGVGLITLENGKLVNNMYDSRVERAMELVYTIASRDYRYPHNILNDWEMNYQEWRSGNILFWDNGQWWYADMLYKFRDRDGWADDEINLVPYPRDPYSDKYYQQMRHEAFMLCSGSKNVDGFKALTQCLVLTSREDEVKRQNRDKLNRDYGWTEKQLDILDETVRELSPVFDFKNGIGEDVGGKDLYEKPVEYVTKYVLVHANSYTQAREEYAGVIANRVNELNGSVS